MPESSHPYTAEEEVADRDHDWIAIVSAAAVMVTLGAIAVMGFDLIVLAWIAVVVALVGVVPVALWRFTDRQ